MSLLSLIYTTLEYFSFFDFKRNLKVGLSAVGKMYITCAMLRNAHSCTYGSAWKRGWIIQMAITIVY